MIIDIPVARSTEHVPEMQVQTVVHQEHAATGSVRGRALCMAVRLWYLLTGVGGYAARYCSSNAKRIFFKALF